MTSRPTTAMDWASVEAHAGVGSVLALILLPCVLATFPRAAVPLAMRGVTRPNPPVARPLAVVSKKKPGTVLWLLFDELDEKAVFIDRSADRRFPELDRLAKESFVATRAFPPSGATYLSLPSLTTGEIVTDARPIDESDLLLLKANHERVLWSNEANVFARARKAGYNTTLIGWFHPYCRILSKWLTDCYWEPLRVEGDPEIDLGEEMLRQLQLVVRKAPLAERFALDERITPERQRREDERRHQLRYTRILERVTGVVTTPDSGLVFVHWSVPHLPGIFDPATATLDENPHSYLDNVALVDRTLATLRHSMEQAGTWAQTTVLVTADHWWRTAAQIDHRVPVIVKVRGQTGPVVYDRPFNTVVLSHLALDVLAGQITTNADVAMWLDMHQSEQTHPVDVSLP